MPAPPELRRLAGRQASRLVDGRPKAAPPMLPGSHQPLSLANHGLANRQPASLEPPKEPVQVLLAGRAGLGRGRREQVSTPNAAFGFFY